MPDMGFIIVECLWYFALGCCAFIGGCLLILGLFARRVDPAAKPLNIIAIGIGFIAGGLGGVFFATQMNLVLWGPLTPTIHRSLGVMEHGVTHYVNATAYHWIGAAESICGAVFVLTCLLFFLKILSIDEVNRFWNQLKQKKTGG